MFRKLIAVLPLCFAPLAAQSVETKTYGDEFSPKYAAMSLRLDADADKGSVTLRTKNGQPGAPATLLVGLERAQAYLGIVGIDGWLLVDPIVVSATTVFEDSGSRDVTFPVQAAMRGLSFTMQAASIRFDEDGGHVDLSNGVEIAFGK